MIPFKSFFLQKKRKIIDSVFRARAPKMIQIPMRWVWPRPRMLARDHQNQPNLKPSSTTVTGRGATLNLCLFKGISFLRKNRSTC